MVGELVRCVQAAAAVQAQGPLHGGAGAGQVCRPAHDRGQKLRLLWLQLPEPGRGQRVWRPLPRQDSILRT